MARKKIYDSLTIEGPVTLMAFPMDPETKKFPEHPAVDERGFRIINVCQLLEQNKNNRMWQKSLSTRYSELMLAGEWDFNLPAVVYIDWFGDMHNAQHVCHAVAMAEAERTASAENAEYYKANGIKGPIAMTAGIVAGIDPKSADFLDLAKTRSHGDVVYRKHFFDDILLDHDTKDGPAKRAITPSQQKTIANWTATAAKIVWLRLWFGEKVRSSRKFPHAGINEVLQYYPYLRNSVQKVYEANYASSNGVGKCINPAYLAALHFMATYSDAESKGVFLEHADYMLDVIANGSTNQPGQPFFELREWLLSQKGAKGNDGLNRLYDAVVFAWNTYLQQGQITDRKVFNRLKPDEYYHMGGVDIPPLPEVDPAAAVATEAAPAEQAAGGKKSRKGKGKDTEAAPVEQTAAPVVAPVVVPPALAAMTPPVAPVTQAPVNGMAAPVAPVAPVVPVAPVG